MASFGVESLRREDFCPVTVQGGNMNGSDAPPAIMERKISEPQVT